MYFNPRSHERSDKLFVAVKVWYPIFQSTLPREERQENGIEYDDLLDISIHAPTRGATIQELSQYNADTISIHAPTRGATPYTNRKRGNAIFQSTLPREERPNPSSSAFMDRYFNPRSHERSDHFKWLM